MPKGHLRFLTQAAAISYLPFLRRLSTKAAVASLQRVRIGALDRGQMHAICAAVLRAGNPALLHGALAWMDGQKGGLDTHVHTYGHAVHPAGMIPPRWRGAPCPDAALLWMRASWPSATCPALALTAALLRHQGAHDPHAVAMYRSFLAIPGWADAATHPDAAPYVGVVLALIDRPHLPAKLRADILEALARRPDADAIFAHAHVGTPDGLQAAARIMRTATQKKPRDPQKLHAPATVRAKQAARAAKKAAAAAQA